MLYGGDLMKKVDGVFEGGGVRGIAFVGAICQLEEQGYEWVKLAGTSAGAIVAALLAAGYTGQELKVVLDELDYRMFLDKTMLQSVPVMGKLAGLLFERAIYNGNAFEDWFTGLLKKKGVTTFKDLNYGESQLKIIASDITRKELLILPDDLLRYGLDPLEFPIAKAVRMSMSIPLFFKPVKLYYKEKSSLIVDGGILSNYPIWIFDVKGKPRWPTFGFKLMNPGKISGSGETNIVSYLQDIISTMLNENDGRYLCHSENIRSISIPTLGISSTQFDISHSDSHKLYDSGYEAAKQFLKTWDFQRYIKENRMQE